MNQTPPSDVAIYIASFDGYSDLWDPFFAAFFKFWPDCPYKVYLGANQKKFGNDRVTTLTAGDHTNWSSRAFEHLSQISEPFVLLMLEDYFLNKPVDSETIATLVGYMQKFDLHAIRLFSEPKPYHAISGYPLIGFQQIGQQNRTSTHATLWRKTSLLELMRKGESLWEFEINGSVRSNRFSGGICGTWEHAISYDMGVEKGKWVRCAAKRLKNNGIAVDLHARPLHDIKFEIKRLGYIYVGAIVRAAIPLRLRQRIVGVLCPSYHGKRVK